MAPLELSAALETLAAEMPLQSTNAGQHLSHLDDNLNLFVMAQPFLGDELLPQLPELKHQFAI